MQSHHYSLIDETLYYERLENGLSVYLLPKTGVSRYHVSFTTKFGSEDLCYRTNDGVEHRFPDGFAHFLEHKMFAKESGDIFAEFASRGASVNAFTSFDRTSYVVNSSTLFFENLQTLLEFVQNPFFTEANVEKERGIINQEIAMYRDKPDWRLYFGLLESLFCELPVRRDIAGTPQTIAQIHTEMLYEAHRTFYHPSNMCLFITGGFEAEATMDWIRNHQRHQIVSSTAPILFDRVQVNEPSDVFQKVIEQKMVTGQAKCMFGFKQLYPAKRGVELLRFECALQLMLHELFAPSSPIYQHLYEQQLITAGFSFIANVRNDLAWTMIGGDTTNPELLIDTICLLVSNHLRDGISQSAFPRLKRKMIGNVLRLFNIPSAVAGQCTANHFRNTDYLQILDVLHALTFEDVRVAASEHIHWDRMAVSIVRPNQ